MPAPGDRRYKDEMSQSAGNGESVGRSVPRVDGVAKVTGAALYVDDLRPEGALYGVTVRSHVAHGVVRGIERDPAFDWTDVVFVTAEDIPGDNIVACIEADQPSLVPIGGTVRYFGEAVALVAASSARRAASAAAHVQLAIDEEPAAFDIEQALEERVLLHGEAGGQNVFKRFEIRKGDEDLGAVFARCDHVVEGTYYTGAQEQMYIEPQGLIGSWDGDVCHIVGSMQCPYYVHKALTALLGMDDDSVVITQSVTGGGFGGKEEYPSLLAGHAALLARKAAAPVKMIYTRDEDIAFTTKRHPARIKHRLGLMSDGTVVAQEVDVVFDGGAYITLTPVVLSRGVLHAAGPYRCPHVHIVGRAVITNTPPHGAFRGFGAPQTTFAYERQMQKAAELVGMSPFAFRRHNMLQIGDTTATGQVLSDGVGSEAVLESVADVAGEAPASETAKPDGSVIRRGRGLAFYFHGAGFTGSGEAHLKGRATVAARAGGRFEVRASSTDIGQGATTMFTQIAATALGVAVDKVDVAVPSTDRVPDSGPTVASRTCMVVGIVVERAATRLRERIEAWAADSGGATLELFEAASAMFEAKGEVAETVQYDPPPGIVWDDETYTGSAYPVFGWACCLVDVAVDMDTYEARVERCVHAVDVGKAINPLIVEGQIEGGTLQALGWALLESVEYAEGRVRNASMTDCIVPTFADAPELETIIVEVPYAFGPHGAKGVGEIPMDGPAAAVADALSKALGGAFDRVPALPEHIQQVVEAVS